MMSHTAARSVKLVADGFDDVHGETDERPMPVPSASKSNVMATAATAPAMTAAHDTAEAAAFWSSTCAGETAGSATSAILGPPMAKKGQYNDDRNWHTKQPKQNAATHVSPPFHQGCSTLSSWTG